MKIKRIAVIGLGQIGGSLVFALRQTGLPLHITGIERRPERLHLLKKHLDTAVTHWKKLEDAHLVVLCLHHGPLLKYLAQACPGTLLMDVCSGKKQIVRAAERRKLRFIGGHPMAGNEYAGEKGWDRNLFHDAPFFLCLTSNASATDLASVKDLISRIGALPIEIDPATHDRFAAMTSHFPAILSLLLHQTTSAAPAIFKGPGYRSMTRLSKTSSELPATFLATNRKNILFAARKLQRRLDRWIKKNDEACAPGRL